MNPTIPVTVIVAGTYLGGDLKGIQTAVGEQIEILGAGYAADCIRDGLVAPVGQAQASDAPAPPPETGEGDGTGDQAESLEHDAPLADSGLAADLVGLLQAAGYETISQVRAATDLDLLKVQGVGKKTLQTIRAAIGSREETES